METRTTFEERLSYETPKVDVIVFSNDVITESHFDPNMGEWDTDL